MREWTIMELQQGGDMNSRWIEKDGVIYGTVVLDKMTTGQEWIIRTIAAGNHILGGGTDGMLRSEHFQMSPIGVYKIVILTSPYVGNDCREFYTTKVLATAKDLGLIRPNADIGCLIREQFSDEEIRGLGLVDIMVMHEPICGNIFRIRRDGSGRWLDCFPSAYNIKWLHSPMHLDVGFAFLAPSV